MNAFLNFDASNVGVAEIIRNEALLEKPEFLSRNEEQQIARLQQELAASQEQLELLGRQTEGLAGAEKARKQDVATAGGTKAEELIVKLSDKNLEMGQTLDQLARETAAQIDQKQAQIKGQLEELKDNRLARHFQAGSGKMLAPPTQPQPQGQPQEQQMVAGDQSAQSGRSSAGADQYSVLYEYDRAGGRARPQGQVRMAGPGLAAEAEEVRELGVVVDQAYEPGSAFTGMQPYTARGTYSLPVTLPEGEVRLDFARPSGQAQLTLWAVPLSTIRKLYGSAAIVAALFAVLALAKVWPKPQSRQPASAKRIIGYGLLLIALSLLLGPLGLLVSLFVIVLCEARRGAFVPQ